MPPLAANPAMPAPALPALHPATDAAPRPSLLRRVAPLGLLLAVVGAFFALGLHRTLSFEALREHYGALTAFVEQRAIVAALLFVAVYAGSTAASLPGGLVLTVAGGLLFGTWAGTGLTVIGAKAGATLLFLIARSALGESLRARAGGAIERLAEGFREGAFSYLLVLSLVPLFPFFVVNLAPAFLGVSLRTFVLATFVGIVPGTFVFSSVGAGLGSVFSQGGEFSPSGVLTPQIITALVGLALLSLVPVAYRRFRAKRAGCTLQSGGFHAASLLAPDPGPDACRRLRARGRPDRRVPPRHGPGRPGPYRPLQQARPEGP